MTEALESIFSSYRGQKCSQNLALSLWRCKTVADLEYLTSATSVEDGNPCAQRVWQMGARGKARRLTNGPYHPAIYLESGIDQPPTAAAPCI